MDLPTYPSAMIEVLKGVFFATNRSIVLAANAFIQGTFELIFKTGNPASEKMRIDENGVMGLGTNSPTLSGDAIGIDIDGGVLNFAELKLHTVDSGIGALDGANFSLFSTTLFITNREAGKIAISTSNLERVTILAGGNLGVGTVNPGQIIDANQGSGNIIADGYDTHSLSEYKENVIDAPNALNNLIASPPKQWQRVPYVSANELREFAIKDNSNLWIEEFGGKMVEGQLDGDDYRGGKLRNIKNPQLLKLINNEGDRLRAERRNFSKWQRAYMGLVADDNKTLTNLPDIIAKDDNDNPIGINLSNYIGVLHQSIIELEQRVKVVEQVKED